MSTDNILLKRSSTVMEYIDFLTKTKWETRPGMDLEWIIRWIDGLYVIRDFDTKELVGFLAMENCERLCRSCRRCKTCCYLEILPQYRNLGYATDAIDQSGMEAVYALDSSLDFWEQFEDVEILACP